MSGRPWTKTEIAALRQLEGHGELASLVARHIGRSTYAVRHKAKAMGIRLSKNRIPAAMDEKLRARWEATIELMKQNLRMELEHDDD